MRRPSIPRAWLAASLAAALALIALRAGAEVDRNFYRSPEVGIEVAFPNDWAISDQSSYPALLATAIDRALGGRMALSLEQLRDGEKVREVAERNRAVLARLGFSAKAPNVHPTGAVIFEAVTPDRRGVIRQAYRAFEGDTAVFVLTLAAPPESMQRYRRAFDDTLRGMTRTRTRRPATEDTSTPASPGAPAPTQDAPPE